MNVTIISPGHPSWNRDIDRVGLRLAAPDNPTLFPYHFLAITLPRIGGHLLWVEQNGREIGAGFIFPRHQSGGRAYTVRYHPLVRDLQIAPAQLTALTASQLGGATVAYYDPTAIHDYVPSAIQYGDVSIGRPTLQEAEQIRTIQHEVWGSPPEFLYPTDIHSTAFHMATSLVARVEGALAGFLFGFDKFGGPPLPADWQRRFNGDQRIESQTMGVLPAYRGMRLGFLLKRAQAEQAWSEGIGVVNWTVDPLQFPNAALNFGLLRAVAFDFYPDLYPFRNNLNLVPASRFAITWLVGSAPVRETPLFGSKAIIVDLKRVRHIPRVNRGWTDVNYTLSNPLIAIEIPADWTALQNRDIDTAVAWRTTTDRIFSRYVGRRPGQYVITGVGVDGERHYLLAERVDATLWERLGHV